MENLKDILIARGYPEKAAIVTAQNLLKLTGRFASALQNWIDTRDTALVEANGYSSEGLMKRYNGMTYPAALLTLDWLDREPEKAKSAIERGIR